MTKEQMVCVLMSLFLLVMSGPQFKYQFGEWLSVMRAFVMCLATLIPRQHLKLGYDRSFYILSNLFCTVLCYID